MQVFAIQPASGGRQKRCGAPRPTKMGDIVSPWRYDAAA